MSFSHFSVLMNIEWLLKVNVPFSYGTSVHALCVFILMHNLNVSMKSRFTQRFSFVS